MTLLLRRACGSMRSGSKGKGQCRRSKKYNAECCLDRGSVVMPRWMRRHRLRRHRSRLHRQSVDWTHRPNNTSCVAGSPLPVNLDLRYSTPLPQMNVCNLVPVTAALNVPAERIVAPGNAAASTLVARMNTRDAAGRKHACRPTGRALNRQLDQFTVDLPLTVFKQACEAAIPMQSLQLRG